MNEYVATIKWARQVGERFSDNRYSRAHQWEFDGGVSVPASASPHVLPPPLSNPAAVDPEEAFVVVGPCQRSEIGRDSHRRERT
jgi:hypothetical protein